MLTSLFSARLLIYSLHSFVLTEQRVLMVVKLSKQTLFPNGYPGPPPTVPSPEEQTLLKEELVQQLEQMTPREYPTQKRNLETFRSYATIKLSVHFRAYTRSEAQDPRDDTGLVSPAVV